MFEQVTAAPADPILGLTDEFRNDARSHKINLGVGIYKNDAGDTPILSCVKKAEQILLDTEKTKNYLSIEGNAEYGQLVQHLLFGADHEIVTSKRACSRHKLQVYRCPAALGLNCPGKNSVARYGFPIQPG